MPMQCAEDWTGGLDRQLGKEDREHGMQMSISRLRVDMACVHTNIWDDRVRVRVGVNCAHVSCMCTCVPGKLECP